MSTPNLAGFDALYRASPDPWGTQTRWYERRKRSLLMAALTHDHYGSIYEAGCGTGHVSALLAERCDRLLATDASGVALTVAAAALAPFPHADARVQQLPDEWPREKFDLVVLGELLYFIGAEGRERIAGSARDSIGAHGTVVACDWKHPIDGYGITGEEAHRHFESALDLPRILEYADDDFVLTAWSADRRSVAEREGLR